MGSLVSQANEALDVENYKSFILDDNTLELMDFAKCFYSQIFV
jgi:hypothetical protein